jgi:DNA-binding protein HU-beta
MLIIDASNKALKVVAQLKFILLPDNQFLVLHFTNLFITFPVVYKIKKIFMRKADLISEISDKTGIPKVDVMFTLETMFKEIKQSLIAGENIYIRGFGSFITKKRAAKIGRNIKKNIAVEIPEHYIPAFKPAKEFVQEVKSKMLTGKDTPQ